MKHILIFTLSLSLTACGDNGPKDPWQGVGSPKIISFGTEDENTYSLISSINFTEVGKLDSFEVLTKCVSNGEEYIKKVILKSEQVKNSMPIYLFLPNEVIVDPEKVNCDVEFKAINNIGSQDLHYQNITLTSEIPKYHTINIKGNRENNTDLVKLEDLLTFTTDSSLGVLKEPILICNKNSFPENNIKSQGEFKFSDLNFTRSLEFPVQYCRLISKDFSNNRLLISKKFLIQSSIPQPTILSAEYFPAEDSLSNRYDNSEPFNTRIIKIVLKNDFDFPLHYDFASDKDSEVNVMVFPGYQKNSHEYALSFQKIPAKLRWEINSKPSNKSFKISPGESKTLELYLETNFDCSLQNMRYNRISLNNSKPKYIYPAKNGELIPEIGFFLIIPKNHGSISLYRLQVEKNKETILLSKNTIKLAFQNQTLHSPAITTGDSDSFIEEFFLRNSSYHQNFEPFQSPYQVYSYDLYLKGLPKNSQRPEYNYREINVCEIN